MSEVRLAWNPKPRFNIAPTQSVPVILNESPDELTELYWGLVPFWAKDMKIGSSLINARAETVATKPAFRDAYKRRHCLVPADGFYEWKRMGGTKVPHHIYMADGRPFAFAGLWESWKDPLRPAGEDPVRTFTIITGEPNELVASIHNRMPVIIPQESYEAWLAPDTTSEQRRNLLAPYPAECMKADPISNRVNSARFDDPAILESAEVLTYGPKKKTATETGEQWLFPPE